MRAWYNGSTSASQAEDEGSIPFARTKKLNRPCVGFIFWIVGDGIEPDKAASAAQGSERSAPARSERGPPKSPRAPAIGLISTGNYTFPSPRRGFGWLRHTSDEPHRRKSATRSLDEVWLNILANKRLWSDPVSVLFFEFWEQ